MKKLITLLVFALFTIVSNAQTTPYKNSLAVSFQPVDLGMGIRYDRYLKDVGVYASVSYGNWALYKDYNLEDHVKATAGLLIPLKDYLGCNYDFTAGINYHVLHQSNEIIYDPAGRRLYELNEKILNPWSFELGMRVGMHRFILAIRTDIIRWEPCVDIGFNF